MASDLKTEIFAYNLFHTFWHAMGKRKSKPNILAVYGKECNEDIDYKEVCHEIFFLETAFRYKLFKKIYREEFTNEKAKNLKSQLDIYEYVTTTCDREDLFGSLTVFKRMLATITFVQFVCFEMHEKEGNNIDVIKYSHMFWAMYFEKFTSEFYERGGWNELRKEVKSCLDLPLFACHFYKDTLLNLHSTKESCVNYYNFKSAVDYPKQKQKFHVSYLWIKFRIENLKLYTNIPLNYETCIDTYGVELLLEDLKFIFDPSRSNSHHLETSQKSQPNDSFSTEMSCLGTYCHQEQMKAAHDDKQIQFLNSEPESRITEKAYEALSDVRLGFKRFTGSRCQVFATEYSKFGNSDTGENLNFDNTLSEIEHLKQISDVDETKISNTETHLLLSVDWNRGYETSIETPPNVLCFENGCNGKSNINIKGDSAMVHSSEGKDERQVEITPTNQVDSMYQMEETDCHRHIYTRNDINSSGDSLGDFHKENNTKKMQTTIDYPNNGRHRGILNTVDGSIANQLSASDPAVLCLGPTVKDLSTVIENVNTDDEIERIRKARKDLRNEQKDPEVKLFLKMLMVLGDKERIEFILSTSRGDVSSQEILKISSKNKPKC